MPNTPDRDNRNFLRIPKVAKKTGLPKSTIYQYVTEGRFPPPVKVSPRVAVWLESEIDAWMIDRVAERDAR